MKVCILEDYLKRHSGKHKFLKRLAECLQKNGVKIVDNDSDILLHIGRDYKKIKKIKTKKIIQRIDGLILNKTMTFEKDNRKILKYIGRSDAVIYQGDFCKNAYEKFLGVNKMNAVINNGADPDEFFIREVKNYYFTCCKWRPHKRLKNICDGFIEACDKGLDSTLYVGGEPNKNDRIIHPNIKYLEWVSTEEMREYLAHSIATVHLSWLDWCPNSMVESIIAGCPIVYSDSGGSPEIGKFGGVSIKDVQWDYKPTFLYSPPQLDLKEISDALFYLKENTIGTEKSKLDINYITHKYIRFFEKVLAC